MMIDVGTLIWALAVVGGTALLGIAVYFAIGEWRDRDRRLDGIRDEVTRQNYAAADREERGSDERPPRPIRPRSNAA